MGRLSRLIYLNDAWHSENLMSYNAFQLKISKAHIYVSIINVLK